MGRVKNGYLPRDCVVPVATVRRRGASLAELLVIVALAGLIGSIIALTLTRQQRFYRRAAEVGFVRESLRDALEVLSADIRQISIVDSVRLKSDSAIEFFSTIGTSVVCEIAGNEIGLPNGRVSGNSLSGFLAQPDTGDLIALYTDSGGVAEKWERHRITAAGSQSLSKSCPVSSGFSYQSDVDAGSGGLVLTVGTAVSASVFPGAPVRFLRRQRYSLYHASDGNWYLGYRRCNAMGAPACGAIQPVSGPYRPYSTDSQRSGLVFEYFDSDGRVVDPSETSFALARVDITGRAESAPGISVGVLPDRISDSATLTVAIRNRVR